MRCFVNDPEPTVPSVVKLWEGANWLEREVWDLFGIRFAGHPDLRRIVLPEEFTAHPLRKDYPLQGRGERHNFPVITRGRVKGMTSESQMTNAASDGSFSSSHFSSGFTSARHLRCGFAYHLTA